MPYVVCAAERAPVDKKANPTGFVLLWGHTLLDGDTYPTLEAALEDAEMWAQNHARCFNTSFTKETVPVEAWAWSEMRPVPPGGAKEFVAVPLEVVQRLKHPDGREALITEDPTGGPERWLPWIRNEIRGPVVRAYLPVRIDQKWGTSRWEVGAPSGEWGPKLVAPCALYADEVGKAVAHYLAQGFRFPVEEPGGNK